MQYLNQFYVFYFNEYQKYFLLMQKNEFKILRFMWASFGEIFLL